MLHVINMHITFFIFDQVFPKTQKLTPTPAALARQDTIDETNEDSKSLRRQTLERQSTERDGATTTASKSERFEKSASTERDSSSSRTDTYDNGLREQSNTLAQRDLIATVLDMKVDSQLEMQRMSQRIGRIEDLLMELVTRLSNDSSGLSTPADDHPQVRIRLTLATKLCGLKLGFSIFISQTISISTTETVSSPTTVVAIPSTPINVTSVSSTQIQSIASTSGKQIEHFTTSLLATLRQSKC